MTQPPADDLVAGNLRGIAEVILDDNDGCRIALQAAASFPSRHHISEDLHDLSIRAFGADYRRTLPLGAYLGTVVLGGCGPTENWREHIGFADRVAGNWENGRFGWRLDAPRALARPVPGKGKQGWWKVTRAHLKDNPNG